VPVGVEVLVADLYLLDHGWVLQRGASLSGDPYTVADSTAVTRTFSGLIGNDG
jgi:hypothetical protein